MRVVFLAHLPGRVSPVLQLFPSLPSPAASGAASGAARAELDHKSEEIEGGGNPHERHHLCAQRRLDIQVGLANEDVFEDGEHDGSDDGGNDGEEGIEEDDDQEGERAQEDEEPAAVWGVGLVDLRIGGDGLRRTRGDSEGGQEDQHEGKDGGDHEEAEHPVGGEADYGESIGDVGGKRDGRAGQ